MVHLCKQSLAVILAIPKLLSKALEEIVGSISVDKTKMDYLLLSCRKLLYFFITFCH